jgi:hypothetical protein
VQRAAEGGDAGGDRSREVGARSGDHARGERRCVHLVLGVQDHRHVEDVRLARVGPLAVQHREEVLGVRELGIGRDWLQTLAPPVLSRDRRRQRRDQARRRVEIGELLAERQRGCGRAQQRHRLGTPREVVDDAHDVLRKVAPRERLTE